MQYLHSLPPCRQRGRRIKRQANCRIYFVHAPKLTHRINHLFPDFKVTELDSEADFFNRKEFQDQVLLTTAEGGSAWTLLNPDYVVVNPFANRQGAPLVIAVSGEDLLLEHFISTWVKLKQTDGTIDALFRHWIRGEISEKPEPNMKRYNTCNYKAKRAFQEHPSPCCLHNTKQKNIA